MDSVLAPTAIGLGTTAIGERELELVTDCLHSGHVSPGAYQRAFEDAVAKRHGKRYATFVNSGQSALHLSLEVLKRVREVRRVLCPAVTYISTLHAVWNAGLEVALCDVDQEDWLLRPGSRAGYCDVALPVDLFGKAWTPVGLGVPVVEDACEAIGAPGVGYGDLVCLSFYPSHSITTGCGGMVLTDDATLDSLVKRLANHGRLVAETIYSDCTTADELRFVFTDEGWSYKNSDLNAALGLAQLERLEGVIARRQQVGLALRTCLGNFTKGLLQLPDPERHTFQMFPIRCLEPGLKPRLTAHLHEHGIATRDAMPIVTQPVVQRRLDVQPGDFPVAEDMAANGFYIGCHPGISDGDLDYIVDVFARFFGGA